MGGHGGGHGHKHDDDDDDSGEWMQLLKPGDLRQMIDYDRARKAVEREIIHTNQAKLAGRSEAERRGRTPGSALVSRAGTPASRAARAARDDAMSQLYSKHVEADHLVKLLPRPGDGEKQEQLLSQKMVDFTAAILSGPLFGTMTMLVTIGAVCIYLYETTLDIGDNDTSGGGWSKTGHGYPDWFSVVEFFLLSFFALELALGAVLADHDRSFWLSTETVVDVLSVVPSVLFVAFDLRLWGFLRFLRLLRWADVTIMVNSWRKSRTTESGAQHTAPAPGTTGNETEGPQAWKHASLTATLKLLAFVARYVLVYAGVVTLLDRAEGGIEDLSETDPQEPIQFTTALYMAAMMLSTVGEGGHGPVAVSPGARVAASIAVLVFLPLAAIRVADVIKHTSTSQSPVRAVSLAPSVRERYVVMCGSVNPANLQARLQELFHADHGNHNIRWVRVVVVSPEPITPRMTTLLQHPRYRGRVTYIQGSPLHDDTLLKAHVDDAAAVMILANKSPRSSHAEDMSLSLQAISVMTHVELDRRQGYGPRLLVELVDPNAALHLQAAGISQVVSSAQVKLSVLAQSCLCPGWSAVVANLLESRAALPPQVLKQGSWLAEYYVGAKKTFYSVEFSPAFSGVLFSDAVVHIFEFFELILVAVETKQSEHTNVDGETTVIVNPASDFRIGKGDRGFLLAESQADARVIWDYMAEDGKGGAIDEGTGRLKERFTNPEEEEALAMETLGTAGVTGMGTQAFVDGMVFSRTLLHCQKKLPDGEPPDSGLLLQWARQFQASDGMADDLVVKKVLASAGLELPHDDALSPGALDPDAVPVPTTQTATNRLFANALAKKPKNAMTRGTRGGKEERLHSPGAAAASVAAATAPGTLRKPAPRAGAPGGRGARERFMSDFVDEDLMADLAIPEVPEVSESGEAGEGSTKASAFKSPRSDRSHRSSVRSADSLPNLLDMSAQTDGSGPPSESGGDADDREERRAAGEEEDEEEEEERDSTDFDDEEDDGVVGGGRRRSSKRSEARAMASSSGATQQQRQQQQQGGPSASSARAAGGKSVRGGGGSAGPGDKSDDSFNAEEILSALRTMEVSNLSGDEACRRLLALRSAAKAAPPTTTTTAPATADAATATISTASAAVAGAAAAVTTAPAAGAAAAAASAGPVVDPATAAAAAVPGVPLPGGKIATRRQLMTARHLVGHVVVMGFPARPSHLECFLRPLKGWTGGAGMGGGREIGGGGVPVVLVAPDVSKLASALEVVDKNGFINTREVYLLEGEAVSQSDLENAGVRTAKAVLVMKDPKSKRFNDGVSGDPLRDAEALVSFIKMDDGLISGDQHVVVELESSSNVRFLHARAEAKSLGAITSLGGAGAGGAADEAHYLWPKYAAGMTYNSSFVDSLFGQAFYRPSRIALIEHLLLLDRDENLGQPGMASSRDPQAASRGGGRSRAGSVELDRECCLRQMAVPTSFLGHSFGEMFQHLAAPPLRCVAFALLRARGTRNAPESYVYTGPRADTVLHPGDKVFVLGKPPVL